MTASLSEERIRIPNGSMRARLHGRSDAPLVLGVPGLSANALSFDAIGAEIAAHGGRLVALDLRGRGRTPAGEPGTHGWESHARDLLDVASALSADSFDVVGHSMGAFVGLTLANLAPSRLRRLVLIDAVGVPDPRAMPPVIAAANRLATTYASIDAFVSGVKSAGIVPWSPFWERHYRDDLVPTDGGVKLRASSAAILEDMAYAAKTEVRAMWPGVRAKSLLLRAGVPMGPGGFIVTAEDRDGYVAAAPDARAFEIDANHYGIMTHPDTATRTWEFLR